MFNFKEELMKNAQENTPEKIMERKKVQTINELFIIIQTICLYRSKKGLTYAICDIRELLQECESYEKELFLKSSGEGFEKAAAQFQMVLKILTN